MRRLEAKPKKHEIVRIPLDLQEFLSQVNNMILAKDESTTIQSDDLLQCERAYGGLDEEGGRMYSFTYFPEKGIRHKWHFSLDITDVERVADGATTELSMWACPDPECHSKSMDKNNTCFYCDYVDD